MSAAKRLVRVVVDGSNLATEGRTVPSLVQLDEAVRAFQAENADADIIVVVDASFEHRVAPAERARFKEAEANQELVTPPAGAIGRGDAFILKIADRIGAVVLSNDSFQEFHTEYPWLFDEGRLVGGKPVPSVGWVFTTRLPVRGQKAARETRKLAVRMKDGSAPTIGTTLTPVKAAKRTAKSSEAPKKAPAKKLAKVVEVAKKATPVKKAVAKKIAKVAEAPKKAPVKKAAKSADVAKVVSTAKKAAKKMAAPASETGSSPAPVVALRRGRQPVNPEAVFLEFQSQFKVGARLEGDVSAFTSHGAVIKVTLKSANVVECYAPTTALGSPAPARARDVLARGDRRTFRLVTVDGERRIAELALA